MNRHICVLGMAVRLGPACNFRRLTADVVGISFPFFKDWRCVPERSISCRTSLSHCQGLMIPPHNQEDSGGGPGGGVDGGRATGVNDRLVTHSSPPARLHGHRAMPPLDVCKSLQVGLLD